VFAGAAAGIIVAEILCCARVRAEWLIDRSIGWLSPFPRCFIEIFFAFSKLFLTSVYVALIVKAAFVGREGSFRNQEDLASVFGFSTSEVALFSC